MSVDIRGTILTLADEYVQKNAPCTAQDILAHISRERGMRAHTPNSKKVAHLIRGRYPTAIINHRKHYGVEEQ